MKKIILVTLLYVLPLFAGIIDTNKKAITIANVSTLSKAKSIANKLSQYDIYIYKTTSTKIPTFITYAVNIAKDDVSIAITDIKKQFKDAYASSNKRIKTLAKNNFDKNIFITAIPEPDQDDIVVNNSKDKIIALQNDVESFVNDATDEIANDENVLYLLDKKAIMFNTINGKEKLITSNTIDTDKKAITVANVSTLKKAHLVAKKLSQYDIYIYKTKTNNYVIYAVNIRKSHLSSSLKNIQKSFDDAYISSDSRIKTLASNNFNNNIFVKSNNTLPRLSSINF